MMLQALLYGIFPAIALGAAWGWMRMQAVDRLSAKVRGAFEELSADTVLAGQSAASASGMLSRRKSAGALAMRRRTEGAARASKGAPKGSTVVALQADLKAVHRWRDVRQVSLVLREMRVWDEDGVPDPEAAEFGEFVLKVGERMLSCRRFASTIASWAGSVTALVAPAPRAAGDSQGGVFRAQGEQVSLSHACCPLCM
jgi:hypothetical protein